MVGTSPAGGRRVARAEEEESSDQLRPVAAAPPLPAALLLSRGGLPWRPACGGGCWPKCPSRGWEHHHWETDGQLSALRRLLQQSLLLAQGGVAQVLVTTSHISGLTSDSMFIRVMDDLVGESGSDWGWVIGEPTCLSAVNVGAGEKMTAGNLDPRKLTLPCKSTASLKFGKRPENIGSSAWGSNTWWVQYFWVGIGYKWCISIC